MNTISQVRSLLSRVIEGGYEGPATIKEWLAMVQKEPGGANTLYVTLANAFVQECIRPEGRFTRLNRGIYCVKGAASREVPPPIVAEKPVEPVPVKPVAIRVVAVGSRQLCGQVYRKCHHGLQCYWGDHCEAAKEAGYRSTEELIYRTDIKTEFGR